MVLSHWYYYISNVLSSDSAVGIIVAQGSELYEDGSLNELRKGQEEATIKTEKKLELQLDLGTSSSKILLVLGKCWCSFND